MRFQSQALRLERDAAAAGEGIEKGRRVIIGGDANQLTRLPHDCFVSGRILLDQPLDEIEEAHARTIAFGCYVRSIAGQPSTLFDNGG